MKKITFLRNLIVLVALLIGTGSAMGETATITINLTSVGGSANIGSGNYGSGAERTWVQNDVSFGGKAITAAQSPNVGAIQAQASNGVVYNTTALPGRLISVVITSFSGTTNQASTLYAGSDGRLVNSTTGNYTASGTSLGSSTPGSWTTASETNYTYFAIKRGSSAAYWSQIVVTYETTTEEPETPTITVTESFVPAMSAEVGDTDTETITVSGVNLEGNITLALSGDNANYFDLSTYSIAPTSGTVSNVSVTITYDPEAAGSHTATLTLSSANATNVVKTLSGTATWPPLDAPVAIPAGAITQTGFTANWDAVAGATEYELTVYTKEGSEASTIFSENFDLFVAGSPNGSASSTDIASSLDTYTQTTGWTGQRVYQAGGTSKMGASSTLGYLTTPEINLSAYSGEFTVEFKAMAWSNDATTMKIFLNDVLVQTVTGLNNDASYTLSSFSFDLSGGTSTSKLRFEGEKASGGRFFLEDIVVKQGGQTLNGISGSPFTVTDGTSKAITGLTPSTTYYYTVVAKNANVESAASNEMSVVTSFGVGTDNPSSLTNIYAHNAKIHFAATAGERVEVYNAVGQKIISTLAADGQNELSVNAKGVMIVKVGSRLAKVIL